MTNEEAIAKIIEAAGIIRNNYYTCEGLELAIAHIALTLGRLEAANDQLD